MAARASAEIGVLADESEVLRPHVGTLDSIILQQKQRAIDDKQYLEALIAHAGQVGKKEADVAYPTGRTPTPSGRSSTSASRVMTLV